MNIVDSSGWLEYLAGSANAVNYAAPIEDDANLLVPSIIVFEVQKRLLVQHKDELAAKALIMMEQGQEIFINHELAIFAAQISRKHNLSLADSIIYASALTHDAALWTQYEHFKNIPKVNYFEKK